MTDFEMDKIYKITGREFLALLSLIPDGDERAKAILENVAGREKSIKVNESQIDFLKPCPFCGSDAKICHGHSHYYIRCTDQECLVKTRRYLDVKEAIIAWNGRVSE